MIPFGQQIELGRHEERFEKTVQIEERGGKVRLRYEHGETVGGLIAKDLRDDGLYGTFKVSETRTGNDVLALARDGNVGLSVGFVPIESRMEGRTKVQTRIDLREVSVVGMPAYPGAEVTAVRSQEETVEEEKKEETPVVEDRSFDEDAFRKEMEERIEERSRELLAVTPPDVKPKPEHDVFEYLGAQLAVRSAEKLGHGLDSIDLETRALADITGDLILADAKGLLFDTWNPELVGYLDARRNLFAAAGKVQFPDHGYNIVFPNTTQRTSVAIRGAESEKGEAASQAYTADQVTFAMNWFAGAVDVSMELISQATNPAVMGIIVQDLLDQYAIATEAQFVTAAEAAATHSGALLDFTDYGTFIGDLIAQSTLIRAATGRPGDMIALTTASWQLALGLLDGDNRRVFATRGSVNADGSALLTSEAVDVGGILCFHSPASVADTQFNTKALRNSEKAPSQVSTTNVALMGQDVGVIGATIDIPLYPTGVYIYAV